MLTLLTVSLNFLTQTHRVSNVLLVTAQLKFFTAMGEKKYADSESCHRHQAFSWAGADTRSSLRNKSLSSSSSMPLFFFPRALALLLFFFLPHSSCFAVSGSQLALISYFFCSCVMLALYQICKFVQLSLKH